MNLFFKVIFILITSKFIKVNEDIVFNDLSFKRLDFTNYKRIKSFIFKKDFYRLNNNNVDSDDSNNNVFNETFQKWKLCVGNSPKLNTELRNSNRSINDDDSSVDIGHRPLLKEIVLGLTSTEDYNRYSDHLFQCLPYANEKCPGIFSVSSNKLLNCVVAFTVFLPVAPLVPMILIQYFEYSSIIASAILLSSVAKMASTISRNIIRSNDSLTNMSGIMP